MALFSNALDLGWAALRIAGSVLTIVGLRLVRAALISQVVKLQVNEWIGSETTISIVLFKSRIL